MNDKVPDPIDELLAKYVDCEHPATIDERVYAWCPTCGNYAGKASKVIVDLRAMRDARNESKRLTQKWHRLQGMVDDNFKKLSYQDQIEIQRVYPYAELEGGHWYTTDLDTPVPQTFAGKLVR